MTEPRFCRICHHRVERGPFADYHAVCLASEQEQAMVLQRSYCHDVEEQMDEAEYRWLCVAPCVLAFCWGFLVGIAVCSLVR